MSNFDHNNPKVGDRVVYNNRWCTITQVFLEDVKAP